jgi:outer membrane protein assembly factor BamB
MPRSKSSVFLLVSSTLFASAALAADWSSFRGPSGDGIAKLGVLAPGGGAGLEAVWRRPLGSGYSAIVTSGNVGVTLYADGTSDLVLGFDLATGKDLWKYTLAPMYEGHDGSDDGPIATPAIADGTVYAFGPRGQLVALGLADGKEVWKKELTAPELREPFYGVSTSPLVVGELLVVATGGEGQRAVTALRRKDGSVAWTWGEDSVSYQSVLATQIAGEQQLVAFTNHLVAGLDPATGKERWSWRHTPERGDGYGQPIALGNDRLLLPFFDEHVAVEVARQGDGFAVKELWRRNSLQRTYALPVLHQGVLYGFSNRFLTAVDPATGETLWKSRPPGGRGLTLIDGHLAIVGDGGALVIVRAARDGYHEVARFAALGDSSYTVPTPVSGGAGATLLVRDLAEMAAVRLTAAAAGSATASAAAAAPAGPAPVAAVAELVAKVQAAAVGERQKLAEAFVAGQKQLPLVEASGKVTFLVRAKSDAGVSGNWRQPIDEVAMTRLADTDLFHATLELDPQSHYEYRLSIDFADPTADPGNPLTVAGPGGGGSELRMPGWRVPAALAVDAPEAAQKGRLDTLAISWPTPANAPPPAAGAEPPAPREVAVYVPAGYDDPANANARYPLFVMLHGGWARDFGAYPALLDRLIAGGQLRPMLVAFVPRQAFPEYAQPDGLAMTAEAVNQKVLPAIAERFRVRTDAAGRGIGSVGSGAQGALYVALQAAPGTWGFVGLQSFYRTEAMREAMGKLIDERAAAPLRAYVEISRDDYFDERTGLDAQRDSKEVASALAGKGVAVTSVEMAGAAGWGRWRSTIDQILAAFAGGR